MSLQETESKDESVAAQKAAAAAKKAAHKANIASLQASNGITKEVQALIAKIGTVKGAIIAYKEYPDRHVVISHDDVGPAKFEFAKA